MGILQGVLRPEETRRAAVTLNTLDSFLDWLVSGGDTASGVSVTETSAMKFGVVFACVKVISETIASLPLHVYERLDRGRRKAIEHPLYNLLHIRPNGEMTRVEFFETGMGHILTWGNFYAEKERKGTGRVKAIWPLRPDKMSIVRGTDGQLYYLYRQVLSSGEEIQKTFTSDEIWHARGLGFNGIVGYSVIKQMRETIGLGMATEEYGARLFSNDSRPGGVLKHPQTLGDDAHKRIKKSWEDAHKPLSQKHRIAILEEGMDFKEIGFPPEDSQFIQARQFQLEEIARVYRVPPHKIGHLLRATFSNIEHQSIEFVTDCLMPWLVRLEQSMLFHLFTEADRARYYPRHLVTGLLRGDSDTRSKYYNAQFQVGALSPNDIRELEDRNPVDGGDDYYVPMNMIPVSVTSEKPSEKPPEGEAKLLESRQKTTIEARKQDQKAKIIQNRKILAERYHQLYVDAAQKIVNREGIAIKKNAKKLLGKRTLDDFDKWLDEFYKEMPDYIERNMKGVVTSYMESVHELTAQELGIGTDIDNEMRKFMDGYVGIYATRHVESSLGQVRAVIKKTEPDKLVDAITQRMDEWEERRPGKIADDEVIRGSNATVHETYRRNGVEEIVSHTTSGKSCPYCDNLEGTTVGIEEFFLNQDEDFQPEGAEEPLRVRRSMKHPPYHGGCECMIMTE